MTYDGLLSVLCDMHAIPILLFVEERGQCIKSDIYREVGRQANMPKKLEILADSGLIDMERPVPTVTIKPSRKGRKNLL